MPGSLHCFDQFRTNLQSEAILVFSIVEIFQFTNYFEHFLIRCLLKNAPAVKLYFVSPKYPQYSIVTIYASWQKYYSGPRHKINCDVWKQITRKFVIVNFLVNFSPLSRLLRDKAARDTSLSNRRNVWIAERKAVL